MSEWTRRDVDMCLYLLAKIAEYVRSRGNYVFNMNATQLLDDAAVYAKCSERDRQKKEREAKERAIERVGLEMTLMENRMR